MSHSWMDVENLIAYDVVASPPQRILDRLSKAVSTELRRLGFLLQLSSIDRAMDGCRLLLTGRCFSVKLLTNFESTVLSTETIVFFRFFLPPIFIDAGITSVVAMTVSESDLCCGRSNFISLTTPSGGSILALRANSVARKGNSILALRLAISVDFQYLMPPRSTLEEAPSDSYSSSDAFIPTDDSPK